VIHAVRRISAAMTSLFALVIGSVRWHDERLLKPNRRDRPTILGIPATGNHADTRFIRAVACVGA
jgi:hypothetical protein